jgi:hypothetical protein
MGVYEFVKIDEDLSKFIDLNKIPMIHPNPDCPVASIKGCGPDNP